MRTLGISRDCAGCRFWSEMVATSKAEEVGHVKYLCLSATGPLAGSYVAATQTCRGWASGHHGAIDAPPRYGEEARALYAAEDV